MVVRLTTFNFIEKVPVVSGLFPRHGRFITDILAAKRMAPSIMPGSSLHSCAGKRIAS